MLGGRTPAVRVLTTAAPQGGTGRTGGQTKQTGGQAGQANVPTGQDVPDGQSDRTATAVAPLPDPTEALVKIPDGTGHGFIEGNPAPISQETVDRLICTSGTVEVSFDSDWQPLNLGREERVFSQAQRVALAARDGGCMWGDCDKPPSRTEAHHLEQWQRDHGSTDIRVGVLLCPPHHLLLHNQGWQILEHQGVYWLRPPATVDPGQKLIRLRSKSAAAHEEHDH